MQTTRMLRLILIFVARSGAKTKVLEAQHVCKIVDKFETLNQHGKCTCLSSLFTKGNKICDFCDFLFAF